MEHSINKLLKKIYYHLDCLKYSTEAFTSFRYQEIIGIILKNEFLLEQLDAISIAKGGSMAQKEFENVEIGPGATIEEDVSLGYKVNKKYEWIKQFIQIIYYRSNNSNYTCFIWFTQYCSVSDCERYNDNYCFIYSFNWQEF